jgi:hypothetical protein
VSDYVTREEELCTRQNLQLSCFPYTTTCAANWTLNSSYHFTPFNARQFFTRQYRELMHELNYWVLMGSSMLRAAVIRRSKQISNYKTPSKIFYTCVEAERCVLENKKLIKAWIMNKSSWMYRNSDWKWSVHVTEPMVSARVSTWSLVQGLFHSRNEWGSRSAMNTVLNEISPLPYVREE